MEIIEDDLEKIEERERTTESSREKRDIERKRWEIEEKRRQIEKEGWPWDEEKRKIENQIREIDLQGPGHIKKRGGFKRKTKRNFCHGRKNPSRRRERKLEKCP